MPFPCIGIGIGLTSVPPYRRLAASIKSIAGSKVIDIYGDNLAPNSLGTVDSWVSAISARAASPVTSEKFAFSTAANGRKCIANNSERAVQLVAPLPTPSPEIWVVCRATALPLTNYRGACMTQVTGGTDMIRLAVGATGVNTWYGAITTTQRDGVDSNTIASGWHIYKRYADYATTGDQLSIGNDFAASSARSWQGEIALVMPMNAATTAGESANIVAALKSYYSIA